MTPMTTSSNSAVRELISFQIGAQEFCVDIMSVREIRGWAPATAIPRAPSYIRGVINLRGVVLPIVDLVLIMSVNPGFGGQKFIQSQVDKIRTLKGMCNEKGVNPWIEVDGGVTPENAWRVIEVGANAIVSGSGVYGAKDYATAIQGIKNSKRPAGVAA